MARWEFPKRSFSEASPETLSVLEQAENRLARDVMQYGVYSVHEDDSVYQAIGVLLEKKVSGLPVVDGSTLVGILSERDVLQLLYSTEFLPGLVKDYMTRECVTFGIEDNVGEITRCLVQNSFRRVPIMHGERLAGVISRADLIKANCDRFRPSTVAPGHPIRRKQELCARDAMTCGILSVQPETPIYWAADLLAHRHITGLPVVDDAMNLAGIVTEKDLLTHLYDGDVAQSQVGDLMTQQVISFDDADSLFDIGDCLIHNDFRRVPILHNGKLTGIISRTDLMIYILKNKSAVFRRRRSDR
ncbi:CBS domain-containing protein [Planctomycetota bacterium]